MLKSPSISITQPKHFLLVAAIFICSHAFSQNTGGTVKSFVIHAKTLANTGGENPDRNAEDAVKEKLAKRQANAAAALLRLNEPAHVWKLLKHNDYDPRGRSYLIHLMGHYPFHPNKDMTRFFIGGTFTNLNTIEP